MPAETCPYCDTSLKKVPKRKSKCPYCGEYIFVKSTPDNRTKRLMTEQQKEEAETRWGAYHEKETYFKNLKSLGITEAEYNNAINRFKEKPLWEVYVSILNHVIDNSPDMHIKKMAHHSLALELYKKGKSFKSHIKAVRTIELLDHKKLGYRFVRIFTSGEKNNACKQCLQQEGTIIETDHALETMPLPCPSCLNSWVDDQPGFCRCRYEPVFDDEIDSLKEKTTMEKPEKQKKINGEGFADMLTLMAFLFLVLGLAIGSYYIKIESIFWLYYMISGLMSFIVFGALATILRHVMAIRKKLEYPETDENN